MLLGAERLVGAHLRTAGGIGHGVGELGGPFANPRKSRLGRRFHRLVRRFHIARRASPGVRRGCTAGAGSSACGVRFN